MKSTNINNDAFLNKNYTVRGVDINSRFFLAPINTGFSCNGQPSQELMRFHRERSGQGIGISYIGNVAIGPEFITNDKTLYLQNDLTSWERLINTIFDRGSLPAVQLACRMSRTKPHRSWKNNNIPLYVNSIHNELNEISVNTLELIIEKFISNAEALIKCGTQVIQIHAAHGYLLSTLLSKVLNSRTDDFGFDRILALKKIIDGIRKISLDIIIDVRISFYEGLEKKSLEFESKMELLGKIVELDLDIISISNGIYDVDKTLIYPTHDMGHGVFVEITSNLATKYSHIMWNAVGNIWDLNQLDTSLPDNLTFSIGRALIADPTLIEKSLNNQYSQINACTRCELCHYYIRNNPHISCPINPSLVNVTDLPRKL